MTSDDFYSLEVLKDGSSINKIELMNKDHFLIGRQPDLCDIGLEHPSVSRVHAVVQYRQADGALLINDLGSAHGTYVNKKMLEKDTFHQLSVGDFIKFGASTRAYILHGPETHRPDEYDSENMRAYRQKLVDRSTALQIKQREEESNGIGWGFREDAENYEDDNMSNHLLDEEGGAKGKTLPDYIKNDPNYDRKFGEIFTSTITEGTSVSDKDQKLLEKLRKKEKKIQNMQQEISRIYMKENNQDNGLTAGQIAAVERNDRRIEVLREQVEAIERTLNEKMAQREMSKAGAGAAKTTTEAIEIKKKKKVKEVYNDDDDRLDTTDQTVDVSTNWRLKKKLQSQNSNQNHILKSLLTSSSAIQSKSSYEAVSYEQLCAERDKKQSRYGVIMKEIQRHDEVIRRCEREEQEHQSQITAKVTDGDEKKDEVESDDDDELDRYLIKTHKEESQKLKQGLFQEAQRLMSTVIELEKYIQISAPALSSLSTKGTSAAVTGANNSKAVIVQQVDDADSREEKGERGVVQQGLAPESVVTSQDPQLEAHESGKPLPVVSTKKNSRHASIMAINNASTSIPWEKPDGDSGESQATKKMRHLTDETSKNGENGTEPTERKSQAKRSIGPTMPKQRPVNSVHSEHELEGGEPVWIPPKNQSGNGITALNAKYGY
jgi:pSer/pThr/pTyr-binding forkhead associated (FHA) protein